MIKIENISVTDSILISMDVTAPLYWWREFDDYRATVEHCYHRSMITSTLHNREAGEFTIDDFSYEHLQNFSGFRKANLSVAFFLDELQHLITVLNQARELYLQTGDRKYWWQITQLLPSSYNQRRTLVFEYVALLDLCHYGSERSLDDEWYKFFEGVWKIDC